MLAALVVLAGLAFLTGTNGEFYRDEDYEYLTYATAFAQAFLHLPAALTSADEALYRLAQAGHALLFHRHGPVPALYAGLFYAGAEAVGVPLTVRIYQLPTAVLAMAAVLLCRRVLRREGRSPAVAWLGAAMLCLSPLFLSLGRGLHTWTWVWIPLGQLMALHALQDVRDGKAGWLAGLLLANGILGDGLFFLTLPAVLSAFALRDWRWSATPAAITAALRGGGAAMAPLLNRRLVVPVAVALGLLAVSGIATVLLRDRVGSTVPLDSLALLALGNHGEAAGALNLSPAAWLHYATVALGDPAPLLLAFVVAVVVLVPWRRPAGVVGSFAIIGGGGFCAVFYVASPYSDGTLQTYQIYTVLPLVLAVALSVARLTAVRPRLERVVPWLAVLMLLSMAGSALHYISESGTALQRRLLAENDFGADKPLFGTKAAGGMVREAIAEQVRRAPDQPVTVDLWRGQGGGTPFNRFGGFRNWTSPFVAFSGLGQKGDYYANFAGRPVTITTRVNEDIPVGESDCGADLCVKVDFGAACGAAQQIVDGKRILAAVVLCDGAVRPAARLDGRQLSAEFDRRWSHLADIFPDRPQDRRVAILSRLRAQPTGQ